MDRGKTIFGGIILAMTVVILIGISSLILGSFFNSTAFQCTESEVSETFLTAQTQALEHAPIVSTAKINNRTYLVFDGVDDVVSVNSVDTVITFWYNDSGIDWQFVVNNSGTLFVNATLATPATYPVFFDGSEYFIGKTDGSTFFAGNIDEVRIYNRTLTTEEIDFLFILER